MNEDMNPEETMSVSNSCGHGSNPNVNDLDEKERSDIPPDIENRFFILQNKVDGLMINVNSELEMVKNQQSEILGNLQLLMLNTRKQSARGEVREGVYIPDNNDDYRQGLSYPHGLRDTEAGEHSGERGQGESGETGMNFRPGPSYPKGPRDTETSGRNGERGQGESGETGINGHYDLSGRYNKDCGSPSPSQVSHSYTNIGTLLKSIPKFTNPSESILSHLANVELFFMACCVIDACEKKRLIIGSLLQESVLALFREQINSLKEFVIQENYSYEMLKEKIINIFLPLESSETIKYIYESKKQDKEPLLPFISNLYPTYIRAYPKREFSEFVNSLLPKINSIGFKKEIVKRNTLENNPIKSIDELLSLARKYIDFHTRMNINDNNKASSLALPVYGQNLKKNSNSMQSKSNFSQVKQSKVSQLQKKVHFDQKSKKKDVRVLKDPKKKVCFRCYEPNHEKKDCQNPERRICFTCSKMGHLSYDCPNKAKPKRVNKLMEMLAQFQDNDSSDEESEIDVNDLGQIIEGNLAMADMGELEDDDTHCHPTCPDDACFGSDYEDV